MTACVVWALADTVRGRIHPELHLEIAYIPGPVKYIYAYPELGNSAFASLAAMKITAGV